MSDCEEETVAGGQYIPNTPELDRALPALALTQAGVGSRQPTGVDEEAPGAKAAAAGAVSTIL